MGVLCVWAYCVFGRTVCLGVLCVWAYCVFGRTVCLRVRAGTEARLGGGGGSGASSVVLKRVAEADVVLRIPSADREQLVLGRSVGDWVRELHEKFIESIAR